MDEDGCVSRAHMGARDVEEVDYKLSGLLEASEDEQEGW